MQGDYSSYMPFIVRALVGKELLHNPPEPLRLYAQRDALKKKLLEAIGNDEEAMREIMGTLSLPAGLKI
jgi:formiminotetrahydrofolate cyclodeaminase